MDYFRFQKKLDYTQKSGSRLRIVKNKIQPHFFVLHHFLEYIIFGLRLWLNPLRETFFQIHFLFRLTRHPHLLSFQATKKSPGYIVWPVYKYELLHEYVL